MVHQMPDIKAVMGREVRVLCPASGYPLENILWSKGEISLSGQWLPARDQSLVQGEISQSGQWLPARENSPAQK
jgi:hypothetical protein